MSRWFLIGAPFALLFAFPATQAVAQGPGERCETNENSAGRSVARGLLGGLARRTLGRVGGIANSVVPVTDMLSDAIIDLLDCQEQRQAVAASDEAIRGGVGTTASWTSETRGGVSGSSSAAGEEQLADGTHCMTVTDVVIIEGQETRADKRMCRAPGSARYARA